MPDSDTSDSIDVQLRNLRSNISDLGYEVDSLKAKAAAALGLGVFLLLLSAGAAYDLIGGKQLVWQMFGVTREALLWLVVVIGTAATILLAYGIRRTKQPDRNLSSRLERLEDEYAELLESTDRSK